MEDVVDRGQRDVLVGATVAGDVVRVEQFVVVDARPAVTVPAEHVSASATRLPRRVNRIGGRCHVVDEGAARGERRVPVRRPSRGGDRAARLPSTAWLSASLLVRTTTLSEAVGAEDEVAVGVGGQQRHVADVGVGEHDAELIAAAP